MKEEQKEEEHIVTLKVAESAIRSMDSGIARIHESYLKDIEEGEIDLVELRAGKKKKVVKLVADRLAKKNVVVLREGDMEDLKVKEGDEVEIHPYHSLKDDMKASWKRFKERLGGKHAEEEEEKEEKK
ncbi:MAG: hypothetical protein ACMUIE_06530 [Thermoplasmatota archaeon]